MGKGKNSMTDGGSTLGFLFVAIAIYFGLKEIANAIRDKNRDDKSD